MKEIEPRKSVNAPALFQNLAHASNLGDGDGEETGDGDGDDDGDGYYEELVCKQILAWERRLLNLIPTWLKVATVESSEIETRILISYLV